MGAAVRVRLQAVDARHGLFHQAGERPHRPRDLGEERGYDLAAVVDHHARALHAARVIGEGVGGFSDTAHGDAVLLHVGLDAVTVAVGVLLLQLSTVMPAGSAPSWTRGSASTGVKGSAAVHADTSSICRRVNVPRSTGVRLGRKPLSAYVRAGTAGARDTGARAPSAIGTT